MASQFLSTHNLSLYTIPAGWILAFAPHVYAVHLSKKSFDIKNPRGLAGVLKEDQTLDSETKATIMRAEGAQQNGFENLGIYASAVVAGNMALLPTTTLNALSLGYLASRAVYNLLYVNGTTVAMGNARSVAYFAGLIGCVFTLFVKGGNVLIRGI